MWVPPGAFAQSSDSGPALGVARISLINGDVTTQRGGDGDWVKAGVNTPLIEGDTIQTGPGSRAEVQLDYSNLIRLDGATEVEVSELANRKFRVRLIEGRITYSELRNGEADVDIETPHIAVRPAKNGRYEIEARYNETTVQVRKGEAEVVSSEGIEVVRSGKLMRVRDEGQGLEFRLTSAEPRGEWDDWNRRRDDRLNKSESYRYVSSSISGAHELDEYGDWRYVSGYGNVWYPQVASGWRPTATGAGLTSTTTAGTGLATSPGAGRPITTGAGSTTRATAGAGTPAGIATATPGGPRWSLSSGTAAAASASA